METTEIIEILKQFITEELAPNSDANELKENQSLLERGIIDSLGIMKLLAFIEEKFQINVPDEELIPENFETLSAIAELISQKQ
jgi:acyl carrier protein